MGAGGGGSRGRERRCGREERGLDGEGDVGAGKKRTWRGGGGEKADQAGAR